MTTILERPTVDVDLPVETLSHVGTMTIVGRISTEVITWDTADSTTVAEAKAAFETARSRGDLTFATNKGEHSTISTFDPTAEAITVSPQLVGG